LHGGFRDAAVAVGGQRDVVLDLLYTQAVTQALIARQAAHEAATAAEQLAALQSQAERDAALSLSLAGRWAADDAVAEPYRASAERARQASEELKALASFAQVVKDEAKKSAAAAEAAVGNPVVFGHPDGTGGSSNPIPLPTDCYTWFGTFDLPTTRAASTVTLTFGTSTASARVPSVHGRPLVTAWATQVPAHDQVRFSWKVVGNTSADFATVLVGTLQQAGLLKATSQAPGATVKIAEETPRPSLEAAAPEPPSFCPNPNGPIAAYRTVARTSDTLAGGLVRDRTYTVTACDGDCTPSRSSPNGVWTVSRTASGSPQDLFQVTGPKLEASPSGQAANAANSPNSQQASFNSPPGWDWALLTNFTFDTNVDSLRKNGGNFPSYQWRPTTSVGSTQEIYQLDDAYQPLQRSAVSLWLGVLSPDVDAGRFGLGGGPSLLLGTGTAGALQQWTAAVVWSPPVAAFWDEIYFVLGGGFRWVPDLVGDTQGETVAVSRTNGSAAAPAGPATRLRATGVVSLGFGIDLAIIGRAAASLAGGKTTSSAGQ
jgi:hypothetical protein